MVSVKMDQSMWTQLVNLNIKRLKQKNKIHTELTIFRYDTKHDGLESQTFSSERNH